MTEGRISFCTTCGTKIAGAANFCRRCGTPVRRESSSASVPEAIRREAEVPRHAYTVVAQLGGIAGAAVAVPWQTIVAGETPDLTAMLARVATPGARALAQRSLKKPGLALAATTILDLFVVGVSGGAAALVGALPRVLAGGTTAALSLVTGSRGGPLRTVTGVVSMVTALIQVVSLSITLIAGLSSGAPLFSTLSMVVAIASSFAMAVRTALLALRRRSS